MPSPLEPVSGAAQPNRKCEKVWTHPDGGGVKPSIVGGAAGALVCRGVALFDATRVGSCPTPLKAKARVGSRGAI